MAKPSRAIPRHRSGSTTRATLQIAAFAAVQAVIVIVLAPLTPHIAAAFPPAYALVAFVQTLLIFTARRFTGLPWGATLAAGLTALLCGPFTAIGWLLAVPLMAAGAIFDAVMAFSERRDWSTTKDSAVAGATVGTVLFAVSLPVMSVEHLGMFVLTLTLVGRLIASWTGAFLSARLVRRLEEAGLARA